MKPTLLINKIVIDLDCSYVVVYASFNSIQVIKKTHIYTWFSTCLSAVLSHWPMEGAGLWKYRAQREYILVVVGWFSLSSNLGYRYLPKSKMKFQYRFLTVSMTDLLVCKLCVFSDCLNRPTCIFFTRFLRFYLHVNFSSEIFANLRV